MASTFKPFIKALDDVVDIMKRNGHEGGPNMRALFAKHKARHREVVARLKAQDTDAADMARASKGKTPDPLKEMKTARRQDAAHNVVMTRSDGDFATFLRKYELRTIDEGADNWKQELSAVVKDKLHSKVASMEGLKELGYGEAKALVKEAVVSDLMQVAGLDHQLPAEGSPEFEELSPADQAEVRAAADVKKALGEAVAPLLGEAVDLARGK